MTVVVMQESKIQKALIQKWLDELPDNIPLDKMEEFIDKITFIHGLEESAEEIRQGRGIPHEQAMAEIKEWIKRWSK